MCQCAPWSLPTRVKDVQALHAALVDPAACAYPDDADHGRVLHDAAATHDAILEGVLAYSWTREQDTSLGVEAELLIGAKSESSAGIGVMTSVEEIKTGFGGRASFAYHWQNASTIAASHSLMSSDRLELRGSQEPEAHFPHLGQLARKA